MGGFLGALGQKLAERWLTLLVLPGVLFLAVATAAHTLGQPRALDIHRLTGHITHWAQAPEVNTVGSQVVLLGAVLAAAAAAGLCAQSLGTLIQRIALAADWRTWPRPLRSCARAGTARRHTRWVAALHDYQRQLDADAHTLAVTGRRADSAPRRAAHHVMRRIATEEPDRPTWCGDRVHAVTIRLERDHRMDLPLVWPYLWLVLPEITRAEIAAAEQALSRATTLAGWAVLYAPLTAWWWPAAPLAAVLALAARYRMGTATETYAQLIEAAARLHSTDLATRLGIDRTGALDAALGDALDHLLRTRTRGTPPPTPDGSPSH